MTHQRTVLWLLRIYGPCNVAAMLHRVPLSRTQLVSALTRLRTQGLAERLARSTYRLTDAGRAVIATGKGGTEQVTFQWRETVE